MKPTRAFGTGVVAFRFLLLAAAYFVTGLIGLDMSVPGLQITLIWMPSGIAVAALYHWGWRYAPAVALGALASNFAVDPELALALCIAAGNTFAPMAAVMLLRHWRFDVRLGHWRDPMIFILGAAVIPMMASATVGALALAAAGRLGGQSFAEAWVTWWLGDSVGVVLGGLALITFRRDTLRALLQRDRRMEVTGAVAAVAAVGLAWLLVPAHPIVQILTLTFPVAIIVWIAFRLGAWPVSVAVLVLGGIGAGAATVGRGPFLDPDIALAVTEFWAYMVTISVVAMLVAALVAERTAIHDALVENEARFRSLTRLSSDWFWEQDAAGRFVRADGDEESHTPALRRALLGLRLWELPGLTVSEDEWAAHRAVLHERLPFRDFEFCARSAQGALQWTVVSGLPILDRRGNFAGYRGTGRDITERKLSEVSLQQLAVYARELEIGHKIQLGFLPQHMPEVPGWQLAGLTLPARHVSGDFYDAFELPGGKLAFLVADVCDKGVGAALYMALFRSLLRAIACQAHAAEPASLTLERTARFVNDYIATVHARDHMFATVFMAVLDPANGTLVHLNAGHEAPLLQRRDGGEPERLAATGPALGLMPGQHHAVGRHTLVAGDMLVAYTDGITETLGKDVQSGEAALAALVRNPGMSPSRMLDAVASRVAARLEGAPPRDDLTLIALMCGAPEALDPADMPKALPIAAVTGNLLHEDATSLAA